MPKCFELKPNCIGYQFLGKELAAIRKAVAKFNKEREKTDQIGWINYYNDRKAQEITLVMFDLENHENILTELKRLSKIDFRVISRG